MALAIENRPMDDAPVDRCVCMDVPFERLKTLAAGTGATLTELSRRTGCGQGCGFCIPYIELMLSTGQTRLPVMTAHQLRRLRSTPAKAG